MERQTNPFDLPEVFYFISKNCYTGSKQGMRFRIDTSDTMKISIWHTPLCFELAEIEDTAEFPLDSDGYATMLAWMEAALVKPFHSGK